MSAEKKAQEQQTEPPEKFLLEGGLSQAPSAIRKLLVGNVTRPVELNSGVQRPVHLRQLRAEMYHALQKTRSGSDVPLSDEEREQHTIDRQQRRSDMQMRDRLAENFLKQGVIEITTDEYGTVSAAYTVLDDADADHAKAPIVLIPGIANDLASVAPLAQELALTRRVIVIGQPESQMGSVTDAFATAVEKSEDFTPHASFYKEAIEALAPNEKIEVWGFSAGAPIAASLLQDTTFNDRVSDATLLNPSASKTMKKTSLYDPIMHRGLLRDAIGFLRGRLATFLVYGRKTPDSKEQRTLKKKTFNAMLSHLRVPFNGFSEMALKNGHKIRVITSTSDRMTDATEGFAAINNPHITVINRPGAHNTPIRYPDQLLKDLEVM